MNNDRGMSAPPPVGSFLYCIIYVKSQTFFIFHFCVSWLIWRTSRLFVSMLRLAISCCLPVKYRGRPLGRPACLWDWDGVIVFWSSFHRNDIAVRPSGH